MSPMNSRTEYSATGSRLALSGLAMMLGGLVAVVVGLAWPPDKEVSG
jgi:hypothetical protein